MNKHLLAQIKEEWPDWEEWIGELWLQWEKISRRRLGTPNPAKRWEILKAEVERVRRQARNEGRSVPCIYSDDMDYFVTEPGDGVRRVARRGKRRGRDPGTGSMIFNGKDKE